ncbi:MAG: TAXI family TRAP transporter solute-binding subunit [Methylococcaceae bacterium]
MSIFKKIRVILIAWSLLIGLYSCSEYLEDATGIDNKTKSSLKFRIGTGSRSGTYYAFGERLKELSPRSLNIELVNTDGSHENLEKMKIKQSSERLDAAIVQNDIAYQAFSGRDNKSHEKNDSFRSGIPLFKEYLLLIVNKSSNIQSLFDLKGSVWVGEAGSGTRKNALRVIDEIGYSTKVNLPNQMDCKLPDCLISGKLNAMFLTRSSVPAWFNTDSFRLVGLPENVVKELINETPYFIQSELPLEESNGVTLSVLAYLVIGKHVDSKDAKFLVDSILNNYNDLHDKEESYSLLNLGENIGFLPVPRHIGAEKALVEKKLIADPSLQWWWFVLAATILGIFWRIHKESIAYDMLGGRKKHGKLVGWVIKQVQNLYVYTVIIIVAVSLYTTSLWILRNVEENYAIENNTQSPLSDISFSDALLWMFVFTGTGETDNKFPQSVTGKLLITGFPILGGISLMSLLGAGYFQRRDKQLSMNRGKYIPPLKDHVLICGWNKKASGIIYGLTSPEAPLKRKVVVVAELGTDTPLAEYDFDHKSVFYCNGDSSDIDILSRAYVEEANSAIILAGINKRASKNIRSIITAQALKHHYSKSINQTLIPKNDSPNIFVISELLYQDNKKLFEGVDTDVLVNGEAFTNRLLSSACFGGEIVNFILDILTHDKGSEIYLSYAETDDPVGHKSYAYSWTGWSLGDLKSSLMTEGVNLIGVSRPEDSDIKLVFKDPTYQIQSCDKLLYLAKDQKALFIKKKSVKTSEFNSLFTDSSENVEFKPQNIKALFIGDWDRCQSIGKELLKVKYMDFSILSPNAPNDTPKNIVVHRHDPEEVSTWKKIPVLDYDRIVILAQDSLENSDKNLFEDQGELDAHTLFIANSLRRYINSYATIDNCPRIIAEMHNNNLKPMFNNCVDIVVPSTLFIEKLLINATYHRGDVGSFITSMLSESDGAYLISHTVIKDDEFSGISVKQLFSWVGSKRQILGYKQNNNTASDTVFWAAPMDMQLNNCKKIEQCDDVKVSVGDIIILVYSE